MNAHAVSTAPDVRSRRAAKLFDWQMQIRKLKARWLPPTQGEDEAAIQRQWDELAAALNGIEDTLRLMQNAPDAFSEALRLAGSDPDELNRRMGVR